MTNDSTTTNATLSALTQGLREGYEQSIAELSERVAEYERRLAERGNVINELRAELRKYETKSQSIERSLARVRVLLLQRLAEVQESKAK